MQDLTALEGKNIQELREIARVLGIVPSTMKKGELLNKIIEVATAAEGTARKQPSKGPLGRARRGQGDTCQWPEGNKESRRAGRQGRA